MRIRQRVVLLLMAAGLLASAPLQAATERYNVDPDHTIVGFKVAHMVVSKTTGRFMDYTGFIEMDPEAKTVKAIEADIKTASVTTNHEKRDIHLKSPDFFNVEKYQAMTYRMTSYAKDGDRYVAKGNLTLLGVTKEIALTGMLNGIQAKDLYGMTRAGFSATGKINRKDFGMVWNKLLDNGGLAVGDEVEITLEVECIKQKESPKP
ncbi:MAG: YceI family protein [Nitrospira sp. CG24D]|nr:MAG: YceI family protein [Nitrospira sp. CG24D]